MTAIRPLAKLAHRIIHGKHPTYLSVDAATGHLHCWHEADQPSAWCCTCPPTPKAPAAKKATGA